MGLFLKNNKYFLVYTGIILVSGLILLFCFDQTEMVLWMNRQRTPVLDTAFVFLTKMGEGYGYLVAAIFFFWLDKRRIGWILLAGLIVLTTSHTLKIWFGNDRPAMFLKKAGLLEQVQFVQGVDILWGTTSFPSGHSMSAFALCALISLWSTEKKYLPLLLCILALLTGISRVYLLAHFQQDVVTGGITGILIGAGVFVLSNQFFKK